MKEWITKVWNSLTADLEVIPYSSEATKKYKFTNRCKRFTFKRQYRKTKIACRKANKTLLGNIKRCRLKAKISIKKLKKSLFVAIKNIVFKIMLILLFSGIVFWITINLYNYVDKHVLNCYEKLLIPEIECNDEGLPIIKPKENNDKNQLPINTRGISNEEKVIGLSNIRRNYFLLFFAIFASVLAIWARISHQKQIRQTQKQIEQTKSQIQDSKDANRNDRFAKALELLGKDESVPHRGALYMLRDLVKEKPEAEYIRCVDVIVDWLKNVTSISKDIKQIAINVISLPVLGHEREKELRSAIAKHKEVNSLQLWPDFTRASFRELSIEKMNLAYANLEDVKLTGLRLQHANLEGANLRLAELSEVNFYGANLNDANLENAIFNATNMENVKMNMAFISGAKMEGVRYLTKEQILQATWKGGAPIDINLARKILTERKEEELSREEMGELSDDDTGELDDADIDALMNSALKVVGIPPDLPDYLKNDPEVQKWLENPIFIYKYYS